MSVGRSKKNHPLTDNGITSDWMQTFEEFPDRFFLGGDQFFVPPEVGGAAAQFAKHAKGIRNRSNLFLSHLPPTIAKAIAYENAMRVYKIKR